MTEEVKVIIPSGNYTIEEMDKCLKSFFECILAQELEE